MFLFRIQPLVFPIVTEGKKGKKGNQKNTEKGRGENSSYGSRYLKSGRETYSRRSIQ